METNTNEGLAVADVDMAHRRDILGVRSHKGLRERNDMPGATRTILGDGRTAIVLSQSWLNTFMGCPELARLEMEGVLPEKHSPESLLGIAVHAGIESLLNGADYRIAQRAVTTLTADIQIPSDHKWRNTDVINRALDCLDAWNTGIHDSGLRSQIKGDIIAIEQAFQLPIIEDDKFVVFLKGTSDLVTSQGLWDWKCSAKKWQQWETQRYNLQSTAYVLGLYGTAITASDQFVFKFGIINPDTFRTSVVEVTRTKAHVDALMDQIHSIAVMITANLARWPIVGQDWRCSSKWCPAWNQCRGGHGLDW